ncbi:MAG: c4-dicarboxylate-binding protein [Alphaproteobacteria bacterium]|nr:c4-dicarboxylate-binding protein [Alphaproteobacteria bacterium]
MTMTVTRRMAMTSAFAAGITGCERLEPGVHWDLSMPWGPSEFHVINAKRFAEEAKTLTDGSLNIHVHPGAILGIKGPETMRAVEEGLVDMADSSSFQQVGTEPILGFESLPYLLDDIDELALLYSIIRPAIEAAYARHGQRIIYIVPWPNQNFFFDRPIATVADFEGLTMRTYDKLSTDLVRGLNMTPIQMPSPDVVPALAAGAIDSVMTSTTTAFAQKYWEFLRYTVRTNHTWASTIMAVNERAWQALPVEHRLGLEALAQRLEPEFWEIARRDDRDKLSDLEANGMITQNPSPQLMAGMQSLAQPIWREFIAQVPESRPLLMAFLEAAGKSTQL